MALRALSTDATLSDLTLSDGTLSPGFLPVTTAYTASVRGGVETVTVTPATNDARASVEYLDGKGAALADTDAKADGHQAALAPGANTVRVKVTAEDGKSTATYTVSVTRLLTASRAESIVPRNTPIWSTTMTVGVGSVTTRRGYDQNEFGSLDGDTFDYGTTTGIVVQALRTIGSSVELDISQNLLDDLAGDSVVLEWAGEELPIASAPSRGSSSFTWSQA